MINLSKLKKQYAKQEWYRQGAAVKPLYIGFPYGTCFDFTARGEKTPFCYHGMTAFFHNHYMEVYFPLLTMEKIADFYVTKRKHPHAFISSLKKSWENKEARIFTKAIKAHESISLRTQDDKALLQNFQIFSKTYLQLWRESIFHDAFDAQGDEIVNLITEGKNIAAKDLHTLTSPTQYSWLQKEKLNLLSLVKLAKKKANLRVEITSGEKAEGIKAAFPQFYNKLYQHSKAFHWIYNDYAVVKNLGPDHFLNEIRHLLVNPEKLHLERNGLAQVKKIATQKASLLKKYKFTARESEILYALVEVASWRDSRKSYNQMANELLLRYAKEFARRLSIPLAEVENVFWWEADSLFKHSNGIKKLLVKRKKPFFILEKPERENKILYGRAAASLNQFLTNLISSKRELLGKPAFHGKVRGKIKIVRNQGEFKKMKPGDILVAANTRPEYVPIMKMAGAIITEEGGITSHAAIVSRELKKPCIVGVQGILHKVRDGDTVEVDAINGIIKLIKKKK